MCAVLFGPSDHNAPAPAAADDDIAPPGPPALPSQDLSLKSKRRSSRTRRRSPPLPPPSSPCSAVQTKDCLHKEAVRCDITGEWFMSHEQVTNLRF